MKTCNDCSMWRIHKCKGCEYFTGTYPPCRAKGKDRTMEPCHNCSSYRIHKCDGCKYFTGVYPPKEYLQQPSSQPSSLTDNPTRRAKRKRPSCIKKNRPSGLKYRKHGLSPEQQDELFQQQNGLCAICGIKLANHNIDHDHETGEARGYLCLSCNIRLCGIENGGFKEKALKYLENPPAKQFYT